MDSEHMVFLVFKAVLFCQSVCIVKSIMKDILALAVTTLQLSSSFTLQLPHRFAELFAVDWDSGCNYGSLVCTKWSIVLYSKIYVWVRVQL